jgi:hypothetical protein
VIGSFLGIRGKLFDQSANLQQHYVLLVSDLYAQGAPLPSVRDRLVSVGYTDPPGSVVTMANRLASSGDPIQQQESDQLHQFAEALVAGLDKENVATPVASITETPAPTTTPAGTPVPTASPPIQTPAPSAGAGASASTPTPQPTNPTAAPATRPTSVPTQVQVAPVLANPGPGKGVIKTDDRKPATVRKSPTSKSIAMAALPYGTVVDILGTVQGQAVTAGNTRWYHVQANGHEGYVYSTLVQAGG